MSPSLIRFLQSTRTPARRRAVYLGQRRALERESADAWRHRMDVYAFKREIVACSGRLQCAVVGCVQPARWDLLCECHYAEREVSNGRG